MSDSPPAFSFPPPPPPPPRASGGSPVQYGSHGEHRSQSYPGRGGRARGRDRPSQSRGEYRGGYRGRGQGYQQPFQQQWHQQQASYPSQTVQQTWESPNSSYVPAGAHVAPTFVQPYTTDRFPLPPSVQRYQHGPMPTQTLSGHIHPASAAFHSQPAHTQSSHRNLQSSSNIGGRGHPRALAPPAVPSFIPTFPSPPAPSTTSVSHYSLKRVISDGPPPRKKPRTTNLLGLTPTLTDDQASCSEDDGASVDEEALLASHSGLDVAGTTTTQHLEFTYKGQTSTLGSPSQIAAWIEERRKHWPTRARIEEKGKASEERREAPACGANQTLLGAKSRTRASTTTNPGAKPDMEAIEETTDQEAPTKISATTATMMTTTTTPSPADDAKKIRVRLEQKMREQQRQLERTTAQLASLAPSPATRPPRKRKALHTEPSLIVDDLLIARLSAEGSSLSSITVATNAAPSHPSSALVADVCKPDKNGTNDSDSASSSDDDGDEDGVEEKDGQEEDEEEEEAEALKGQGADNIDPTPSSPPSETDSAPDEIAIAAGFSAESSPPPAEQVRHVPRQLCKVMLSTGKCKFKNRCRFSHELTAVQRAKAEAKGRMGEEKAGRTGRKGLYEVMREGEKKKEDEWIVAAIRYLGQAGMLDGGC